MAEEGEGFRLKTTTCTELLRGLRSVTNQEVWRQFVDRYRPMIERYGMRYGLNAADAQDAAQQTLISFCSSYQEGKYDADKGRLRVWLFGIARNQIRNLHRRHQRKEQLIADESGQTGFFNRVPDDDELERGWDEEWRDSVIRQCLEEVRSSVDAKSIEAFELFAWRGLDAAEVGRRLDMTPNAVFIAKHRILKRIRALQTKMEDVW